MNKSALKTFATNARKELLKKVEAKAMKIGITEANIKKADIESSDAIFIDGKQLSKVEKTQRDKLITRIKQIGFKQVLEEVAYTWFNRFTALRYMEVNEYLPTDVRVLSSTNANSAEPDMINEAVFLELDIDKEYVYDLKLNNKTDELFKYLIIKHCNDLNRYLPFMFETIDDYTEILFPEGLLAKDSVIRQMTDTEIIPEDNWNKVEVIGWLYQYYISDEKDRVIQAKKKYKKEEIPFATQLFTPDWIVRYLVQNSLGRYWVESHPEHRDLLENWEFYLENPNPERDFEEKIAPYINKELKVEDIKCFDPAMGSGHILVYMFDVLFEIYSKCGYTDREIPRLIIENNLFGLDIDDRAYQLACFSVVMKASEYNNRFFRSIEREGLTLNLASIQETNILSEEDIVFMSGESVGENFDKMKLFLEQFKNAKVVGSLIKVEPLDKEFIDKKISEIKDNPYENLFDFEMKDRSLRVLRKILHQATIMSTKFDVFITNPPYAGNKYITTEASSYLMKNYTDVKSDLYSAFIEYSFHVTKSNGQIGLITPFGWMFISSFEQIRKKIVENKNISSLIQLEYNGFEAAMVPVCLFTMRNYKVNLKGEYLKLTDFKGIENQPIKTLEAVKNSNVNYRYSFDQNNFSDIPGTPIAFWVSEGFLKSFSDAPSLETFCTPRQGFYSGDNNRFLRFWFEVESTKFTLKNKDSKKWYPYNKGGEYRKWYGNNLFVVDWVDDGYEIKNLKDSKGKLKSRPQNIEHMLVSGITWGLISSGKASFRFFEEGFLSGHKGPFITFNELPENMLYWTLGILNSKIVEEFLKILSPTIGFEVGHIKKVPLPISDNNIKNVTRLVKQNISLMKADWDLYELSWDFVKSPFMQSEQKVLKNAYYEYSKKISSVKECVERNEVKINEYLKSSYSLESQLDISVDDVDVNIRIDTADAAIKSFISYFVGNSFGRYSIDQEGLIYAGGDFDHSLYLTFPVNQENILPILPGAYFENDIVSMFVDFVKVTFGEETITENLDFVVDALGRKKGETARDTLHRYFLNDFYKDHVQTYKKRPIYWLFTSGKEKAFNCLIYIHRYDKTTLSRIRTDYLHEYQIRLDAEKKDLLRIIEGDYSTKEISNAKKELKILDKKIEELKEYDEQLHHMADRQIEIDLDDGVVVNYEKLKGLVAKI
jgi:type II restriction/modification system DNA methylase subunit YeeA